MKFLAGLGAFVVLLWLNTPFTAALFLGVAVWVILHFAKQPGAKADDSPSATMRPAEQSTEGSSGPVPEGLIPRPSRPTCAR
jgi:hypothetical protein